MIKSIKAKRTQAISPILEKARRALLLSGTPAMSRPIELYTQVHAICPRLFPTEKQFGLRYCDGQMTRFGPEYKGATNITELHLLLKRNVMIRRLKKTVLKELPAKRRQAIVLNIPKNKCNKLVKSTEDLKQMLSDVVNGRLPQERNRSLMQLYESTGICKIDGILEYLTDLRENRLKFLVFAHHQKVLNGIGEGLQKLQVPYIRIDGKTSPEKRQEYVNRFQNDPNCQVAIISITAGGTGLTLTAASTVVFAELYWTPGTLIQAEDRVHRIGQLNSVNIHYILGKNTLDDELWPLISRKLEVLGSTLDGKEESLCIESSTDANSESGHESSSLGELSTDENITMQQGQLGEWSTDDLDLASIFDYVPPPSIC